MDVIKCHFCGYVTNEEQLLEKCGRCPLKSAHAEQGVMCCPNCGIELKMKSSLIELIEAMASRLKTTRR